MRLTWALVLLLPLPAYALELWGARQCLEADPMVNGRHVAPFGVGSERWLIAMGAIGAACIVPRLFHVRAMRRLRGRARHEIDPGLGTYRTAPPRVWRWASEEAAITMAQARYAGRSAATLALLANVELAVFFQLMPVVSFHCFGSGTHVYVPKEDEHVLLIGLVMVVVLLELPRWSAVVRPIRDLLGAGARARARDAGADGEGRPRRAEARVTAQAALVAQGDAKRMELSVAHQDE
jgi:hypothetical protein